MGQLWRIGLQKYKGLPMHLAPGTHEAAVELILKHCPHRAGVLDLGGRHGALVQRLRDNGFTDLNVADLDAQCCQLPDVTVTRADFNTDFSKLFNRKFKLICSSDCIEHLDSHRHFLKQCYELLDDDGYLMVTLPNIAYWLGRVKFLIKGEHWGFGAKNYIWQRHISPATFDAMRLTMKELGFPLVEGVTRGSFSGPLKRIVTAPFDLFFRAIGGPTALGECAIYLAKKGVPDGDLTKPMDYRPYRTHENAGMEPAPAEVAARNGEAVAH